MNAYALVYDRQIARPAWSAPFLRGGRVVVPLGRLDRDIHAAVLLQGSRHVTAPRLANRGDGTGELIFTPGDSVTGRFSFVAHVRYSDGIQHVEDTVDAEVLAAAELAVRYTEHGTVRVDLPVPLAVTPALLDPAAYRIVPLEGPPLRVRTVGREMRRPDAEGRIRSVDAPTYLELFVTPHAAGTYRLELPALRTYAGRTFGPASGTFVARLVKRSLGERTLGPRSAHGHELAPGVVLSALFAEDERAGGHGAGRG